MRALAMNPNELVGRQERGCHVHDDEPCEEAPVPAVVAGDALAGILCPPVQPQRLHLLALWLFLDPIFAEPEARIALTLALAVLVPLRRLLLPVSCFALFVAFPLWIAHEFDDGLLGDALRAVGREAAAVQLNANTLSIHVGVRLGVPEQLDPRIKLAAAVRRVGACDVDGFYCRHITCAKFNLFANPTYCESVSPRS